MKLTSTLTLLGLCIAASTMAQNQITTPSGQPLVIGNNGVKLSNLNASSNTGQANGKVLTVDANGLLFLAPDQGGTSQWGTSGNDVHYANGNVGIGTTTPLQRLHVNGDINLAPSSGLRIDNVYFLRSPASNVFIGRGAGNNHTSSTGNLFVGFDAGSTTTTGSNNMFMGYEAGKANVAGENNVFIGTRSGLVNTASFNTFIGSNAGAANTSGTSNFFAGTGAGQSNTTANNNSFIGRSAGLSNTVGSSNSFVGSSSGYSNVNGSNNMFLGTGSGYSNTSGNNNTYIGVNAGSNNTTGSNNIFLGFNAKATNAELSNAIAIGYEARVSNSNSLILGGTGANQVNVGIGNVTPSARLHVTASGTTGTGVRFENLPTSNGTVYNLYVDGSGNLMRASTANAREAAAGESNWSLTTNENIINSNAGGVIIGAGVMETPKGYKLYVTDGILTEKVKVALRNTSDWSDHVFQDSYKLNSIQEVDTFIKANKHLPGIPSAEEMVKNGNDLHKTDALLLGKIEEMMLYIIELKKENQLLNQKILKIEKERN